VFDDGCSPPWPPTSLLLRLHEEPDPTALDHDRLTLFRGVE
jgi:hypothetical protein